MKPDKIVAIIVARSDSSRLPAKHLKNIGDHPMIFYLIDRLNNVKIIDEVVVATTDRDCDNILADVAIDCGAKIYRGELNDVIGRYYGATKQFGATITVKANGDNPLLSTEVIELGLNQLVNQKTVLTGKNAFTGLPVGIGAEIIPHDVVKWLYNNIPTQFRDDPTNFIFKKNAIIKPVSIEIPNEWKMANGAITIDTSDDLSYLNKVVSLLPEYEDEFWTIDQILNAMKEGADG